MSNTTSGSAPGLLAATTTIPGAATTQIHALVTEAQRLSAQITNTRTELSKLEQQVLANAAKRSAAQRQSAPVVSTVLTGTAPVTHATTGASSATGNDNSDSNGVSGDN
jgi:hypothetical protein